jgi:hypothetical protein
MARPRDGTRVTATTGTRPCSWTRTTPASCSPAASAVYRSTNSGSTWVPISGDLTTNPASPGGLRDHLDRGHLQARFGPLPGGHGRRPRVALAERRRGLGGDHCGAARAVRDARGGGSARSPGRVCRAFGLQRGPAHTARLSQRRPGHDVAGDQRQPAGCPRERPGRGPGPAGHALRRDRCGVFETRNLGGTWVPLGGYMPVQPVWDLELHQASRQLFAFTHGRSAWKLDLNTVSLSHRSLRWPRRSRSRHRSRTPRAARHAATWSWVRAPKLK